MAFLSKAGSILRQAVSKQHVNQEISAFNPSIFQAIRCKTSKVFVGGLSRTTNAARLTEAFRMYGVIWSAKVIYDRRTGISKRYGFVEFMDHDDADAAITAMDRSELDGHNIRVMVPHDVQYKRSRQYSRDIGYYDGNNGCDPGYGAGSNFEGPGYASGGNYGVHADANTAGNYGASNFGSGEKSFGTAASASSADSGSNSFAVDAAEDYIDDNAK